MKKFISLGLLVLMTGLAFGQNEQAPMMEKEIEYKDWSYPSIKNGERVNLRSYTVGKKLTIVVYYAPWCPNWRFDAPRIQNFYDKYKDKGLGIIAVGLYDPLDSMKANLDAVKITFPAVYESADREARLTSLHYKYRTLTGDQRKWASPWYIFLLPSMMEKGGDILTKKTFIINGEIIEAEGEAFIRKQLGLAPDPKAAVAKSDKIEVCDPPEPAKLIKP